ncbi:MAG: hypothetical protein ACI81R_003448 [Bradymonadia bacterium]|jgi:hypothetical protein
MKTYFADAVEHAAGRPNLRVAVWKDGWAAWGGATLHGRAHEAHAKWAAELSNQGSHGMA